MIETDRKGPQTLNVLELGSGLGRCGLLVYRLLQSYANKCDGTSENASSTNNFHVYLTDGDTDTLHQLRQNVADNTSASNDHQQHISCHQLLWGSESTRQFCARHNLLLANKSPATANSIDLVIASDVIYVDKVIAPLFETVAVLLQQQKSGNDQQEEETDNAHTAATSQQPTFLMAHSDRREGSSVNLTMVLDGAKAAGLEPTILQEHAEEGIFIISSMLAG